MKIISDYTTKGLSFFGGRFGFAVFLHGDGLHDCQGIVAVYAKKPIQEGYESHSVFHFRLWRFVVGVRLPIYRRFEWSLVDSFVLFPIER